VQLYFQVIRGWGGEVSHVQELEMALKTLQVWEGPEQLKRIFAELDIDGNGSIEFYEFCTQWTSEFAAGMRIVCLCA
jgi:hypothetical protein